MDIDAELSSYQIDNFVKNLLDEYLNQIQKKLDDISKNGKVTQRKLNRIKKSIMFKMFKQMERK